jgi:hypothetical protein
MDHKATWIAVETVVEPMYMLFCQLHLVDCAEEGAPWPGC